MLKIICYALIFLLFAGILAAVWIHDVQEAKRIKREGEMMREAMEDEEW